MKRAVAAIVGLLVAGALVAGTGLPAGAQPSGPPFSGTPDELEAYRLYQDQKPLAARTKAEQILRVDPYSIAAHFVLGNVMREAEGSLARAMYHLGRARELYETRYGADRPPGAPWQLHRETLHSIQQLAGEIEQYEYQLQVIDYYDSLYDPDLTAEHAWPLLHLGRWDDARRYAQLASQSTDEWQKSLGLNALCAIEGDAQRRQPHYDACKASLERARARAATAQPTTDPLTAPHVAVHAYNAALAALSTLRYAEVETIAAEGTRRLEFTTANPWRLLARLYGDGARMDKAVDALREMQRWRRRQPANLRDQDHAENDATIATILLLAGELDAAADLATRALDRPDRRGLTTSRAEQATGAHALLRRAIIRTRAERMFERASVSGTARRVSGTARALWERTQAWPDEERVATAASDRLVPTLRLYVHGGLDPVPSWLVGDLVEILGPGVVAVGLRQARAMDADFPAIAPLHDAIEAEVALGQGDEDRALRLARASLERLPASEAVLQARVAAVGAEAARELGDMSTALGLYERALQRDPGVIRRMGLALPAQIRLTAGGEAAARAAELLGRSPRLRDEPGFVVTIEGAGAVLRACLRSAQNNLIGCADAPARQNEDPGDWGARLADEFHERIFAFRGLLSATDLHSLDGSNTVASEAAREQIHGVLDDLTRPQ